MQAFVERRNHNLHVYNHSALSTRLEKRRVHGFIKGSFEEAVSLLGLKRVSYQRAASALLLMDATAYYQSVLTVKLCELSKWKVWLDVKETPIFKLSCQSTKQVTLPKESR